jgi:hypothetical protein
MPLFFLLILLLNPALSAAPPEAQEPGPELVLRAYQYCYPGKAGEPVWQNGDWTITVGAETFYWAGGRLLPAALRGETGAWLPHSWMVYPDRVPSPELYSPGYIAALRIQGSAEAGGREDQHRAFQAALYGGLTRREIEALLVRIEFLGQKIVVHRDIAEALQRVETSILNAALQDAETAAFTKTAGQIGAYNWRQIRGSNRMSYHSWGLAVDILPQDTGGGGIYWLWERTHNEDWMLLPLERRWKPPDRVIDAFEHEGFIWGGKWPLYDNMHFEYRPELHEINRLLAAGSGEAANPPEARAKEGPDLHHLYPAFDAPGGPARPRIPRFLIPKGRQPPRRTDSPVPPGK